MSIVVPTRENFQHRPTSRYRKILYIYFTYKKYCELVQKSYIPVKTLSSLSLNKHSYGFIMGKIIFFSLLSELLNSYF